MPTILHHDIHHTVENINKYDDNSFMLGPFDIFPFYMPISVLWVYSIEDASDTTKSDSFVPFHIIKHAAEILLTYYPQLAGRGHVDETTGKQSIRSLEKGFPLIEASFDEPLAKYRDPNRDDNFIVDALPQNGTALLVPWSGDLAESLFSIQYSRFSCGSVSLGLRVSHAYTDGTGFSNLYRDFADIYRQLRKTGTATLSNPPYVVPYQYNNDNTNAEVSKKFNFDEKYARHYHLESRSEAAASFFYPKNPRPISGRNLDISEKIITALKLQGQGPRADLWTSTYASICAFIHQCILRSRVDIAKQQEKTIPSESKFISCVYAAQLANFPSKYFPGGVVIGTFERGTDYLYNCQVWEIAVAIKEMILSTRPAAIKQHVDAKIDVSAPNIPSYYFIRDPHWTTYASSHLTFWSYTEFNLDSECSFVGLVEHTLL